jgi:hypothetical protein
MLGSEIVHVTAANAKETTKRLLLEWDELFPPGSLPEKRLQKRAVIIGNASSARPGAAMTEAFDDARNAKAAYDFIENERMSLQVLLDPATRAVGRQLRGLPDGTTVLSVQDTTEVNLAHLATMTGLGEIGNPKNRGLFSHASLAVGTDGAPIGLLGAETWIRPIGSHGKARARRAKPFDDKESARWWRTIEQAEERVRRPGLLLHVGDRENDIYEVFVRSRAKSYRLLVRAAHDRKVEGDGAYLWAQVSGFATSKERRTIHLPEQRALPRTSTRKARKARPARDAEISVQFGSVTILAPHGAKGSVELSAVRVFEVDPPDDAEPIEWLLLCSDALASEADAWLRVDWYGCRWSIEEFHKVLKSGCRVEQRQYETRATFEVAFGFSLLTAARLLALTKRARTDPDQPASQVLTPDEEEVLLRDAEAHNRRPTSPLRLVDAVVLIAKLGGYLGRKNDGPPGWLTLWRGYRRLCALVDGYKLAQASPPRLPGESDAEHRGI